MSARITWPCPGNARHWYTPWGQVGDRRPFCIRCKSANPASVPCDCGARRMKGEHCPVCDDHEVYPCICVEYPALKDRPAT